MASNVRHGRTRAPRSNQRTGPARAKLVEAGATDHRDVAAATSEQAARTLQHLPARLRELACVRGGPDRRGDDVVARPKAWCKVGGGVSWHDSRMGKHLGIAIGHTPRLPPLRWLAMAAAAAANRRHAVVAASLADPLPGMHHPTYHGSQAYMRPGPAKPLPREGLAVSGYSSASTRG